MICSNLKIPTMKFKLAKKYSSPKFLLCSRLDTLWIQRKHLKYKNISSSEHYTLNRDCGITSWRYMVLHMDQNS